MIIAGSVGSGGKNLSNDVQSIQIALNTWLEQRQLGELKIDSRFGPKTLSAIKAFQKKEMKLVDGRIDTNGPSIRFLADFNSIYMQDFIVKNSTLVFDSFDACLGPLRGVAAPVINTVADAKGKVLAVRFPVGTSKAKLVGATPDFAIGFAMLRVPLLGAVQAIPVVLIIAIFALLFVLSIIVAKPGLEHLAKQLQILMNAILEALRGIRKTLTDAFQNDIPGAQKCLDPFKAAMALLDDMLQDLKNISADPATNKFQINSLVNKLTKLEKLANEFLACMGLPPITIFGP